VALDRRSKGSHKSISNTQEALPLAKLSPESHTLGDLEARDDAPLDLRAGLPGSFTRPPILPPGLIEGTIPPIIQMAKGVYQSFGINHIRPPG
jgi:hypothetical protein